MRIMLKISGEALGGGAVYDGNRELSSMSSEKLRKIGEKGRLRMYEEESTEIDFHTFFN